MKKIILTIIIVSMLLFSSNVLAIVRYHPERDEAQEAEIMRLSQEVEKVKTSFGRMEAENRELRKENQDLKKEIGSIKKIVMTFQEQMLSLQRIVLSFVKTLIGLYGN